MASVTLKGRDIEATKPLSLTIPADDDIVLTGEGLWKVYNCSYSDSLEVVGGVNSTLYLELFPLSGVEVQTNNTISLNSSGHLEHFVTVEYEGMIDADEDKPVQTAPLHSLAGKRFWLDAGHGGKDPGAVNAELGLKESEIALDIVLDLARELTAKGAEVALSRDNDTFVGLTSRATQANNWGATAFISVHLNAADSLTASGFEVLVYNKDSVAGKFASLICDEFAKNVGFKDRGVKERPDLTVLQKTRMPAVLCEVGFISNSAEAKLLAQKPTQTLLALSIANAAQEQFGAK